ncbi:MAG: Bug family tripartite tricarboxylate transporter substrate binding protein [Burkholderiales bacterium]
MNKTAGLSLLVLVALVATPAVLAQTYPAKSIRFILPYPPGGGSDTIARPVARKMSENIGHQVVVDNRGGAGGSIGMEAAARSAPDGYTIAMGLTAQLAVNVSLYNKLPYDPVKDFEPVTLLGSGAYLLVAHPSLPVKTMKDVIAVAKKHPDEILYASSGNGSGAHLATELLKTITGIKLVHVPYKGGGPALVDTISGQTQLLFATPIASAAHIKAGRIRAIAVSTTKRVNSMPGVPTVAESGVPGYDSGVWYGIVAPKGTPQPVIARINEEFRKVLGDPGIRAFLTKSGIEPDGGKPGELGRYMVSEIAKWARVIKAANIRLD